MMRWHLKVSKFWKDILFFSILPKNERKISTPVGKGKNLSFQVNFMEELETPKRLFEINWLLAWISTYL